MPNALLAATPEITVTALPSRLDRAELRNRMREAVAAHRYLHVIDVDSAAPLSTAAVAGLVESRRMVRERGGQLHLVAADPQARKTLAITGLDRVFRVYATVDEAVRSLSAVSLDRAS